MTHGDRETHQRAYDFLTVFHRNKDTSLRFPYIDEEMEKKGCCDCGQLTFGVPDFLTR